MNIRLLIAFLGALLLHSAAGVWLGKIMAPAETSLDLPSPSFLEVELSAPPETAPPETALPNEAPPGPPEPEVKRSPTPDPEAAVPPEPETLQAGRRADLA